MSGWPFVIAAYGLVAIGTAGLVMTSLMAMRRAEVAAAKPRQ